MDWIEEADGVFRGGGVKGLGLAGALLGFAEHPEKPIKKWVNVAGASAGAILACYLACGHDAADMADLMKKTKFGDFQDFPPPGKLIGGGGNLFRRHGLARGEAFRLWFGDQLEHKTFASTKNDDGTYRLKLIAVDVTNKALLVLPDDLERYRRIGDDAPIDPDQFEIADAARMSMSIPYFFEPVQLVRDRVFVEDPGDCGGLAANVPADRIDVARERKRTHRGQARGELPRAEQARVEAAAVGDHRRRHALELPRLALRRRFAGRAAPATDVRLHAHRRQRSRRRREQGRRRACHGQCGSASTSSIRRRRRGTRASSRTRRASALSRSMRERRHDRVQPAGRPPRTC